MDYRYLKVFIESAQTLNFAAAAQRLAIAPSAVSRQIQLFEESVGEPLFLRNNRKVILTQKGQEILNLVRPLENWRMNQVRQVLKVAGLQAAMDQYFWPRILENKINLDVDLNIFDNASADAISLLEKNQVDLAFVNKKEKSNLVSYFKLGTEQLALISKKQIAVSEIHLHPWIFGESGDALMKLSQHKKTPPLMKVGSLSLIYDLVEKGAGIAIVPITPALEKRKLYVQTLDLPTKTIFLAMPNFENMPSLTKRIYRLLVDS